MAAAEEAVKAHLHRRTSEEPHISKYWSLKTIGKGDFDQHIWTGKEVIILFYLIFFCVFPFSYDDCCNRYIILISVFALLDSYYFRSPQYFPVELSIFLSWTWPWLSSRAFHLYVRSPSSSLFWELLKFFLFFLAFFYILPCEKC